MYKDPQLSNQAKRLCKELASRNVLLSHAQSLEVLARISGVRTLHVAHAKNNAAVSIEAVAEKQAADLMFETLGRFEGSVRGLLASIKAAFDLKDIGSRAVEGAFHELFETAKAPKVSALFDSFKLDELPALFDTTVARLKQTLEQEARATEKGEAPSGDSVYEAKVYDWRLGEGEALDDLPVHHRQGFDLRVTRNPAFQLFVDIAPTGVSVDDLEGKPQMSLFVEINAGRPCVHMSNSMYGDQVLTVFFTEEGLYLRPDSSDSYIRTGVPSATSLAMLKEELEAPYPAISHNTAYIET